jgi:3-deoxy-manno-octulosonate cytidylyltransferase (CMP-KDO synthetase)
MGSVVAIIPARYESTRFPGKPLALIAGKPMIQHVYERTRAAASVTRTLVATDDARIADAVRAFGGEVVMTQVTHPSGTDRIAEAAAALAADVVVNVQGDVPFLHGEMIEAAVELLRADGALPMATIKAPIRDAAEMANPNVVKVVTDRDGYALYFSRSPLPCWRDAQASDVVAYKHIGLYAYRRDFLLTFARLAPTPLERAEKLEQLRALEWGFRIKVAETDAVGVEVDTPQDLERARAFAAGPGRELRRCGDGQ